MRKCLCAPISLLCRRLCHGRIVLSRKEPSIQRAEVSLPPPPTAQGGGRAPFSLPLLRNCWRPYFSRVHPPLTHRAKQGLSAQADLLELESQRRRGGIHNSHFAAILCRISKAPDFRFGHRCEGNGQIGSCVMHRQA